MSRKRWLPRGFSFSWKRALGISALKGKISRGIGIPLTRSGRQRKAGRMLGCLLPTLLVLVVVGFLSGCAPTPSARWMIYISAQGSEKITIESQTAPQVEKTQEGYTVTYTHWYSGIPNRMQILGTPVITVTGPTEEGHVRP